MIILKTPMNGRGGIIESGTRISLPPDVEKAMIEAGNAERIQAEPESESAKQVAVEAPEKISEPINDDDIVPSDEERPSDEEPIKEESRRGNREK